MDRQHSNVGNFIFQHKEPAEKNENKNKVLDISASDKERLVPVHDNCIDDKVRMSSTAKLSRAPLNYSQEDIHALASKAEFLVLTRSNTDLRRSSSSSGVSFEEEEGALEIEDDRPLPRMSSVVPGPGLYSLDMELQEEAGLSGSWEHDLQEQYVSEGSVLGTWDNSMKSVLCFGEDYSNYIRRKSELPSIDIISSDMIGLQASPRDTAPEEVDPVILLRMSERDWLTVLSDLNSEKEQEPSFGDVDNFDRLIQTCALNLDTLKKIKFGPDVIPKCLPQDQEDLIGTWEELFVELKSRLDQCLAFNGINKEIEIISLKVESISNQKLGLETQEENDAISFKACLKKLHDNLKLVRPDLTTTMDDVHNLQSKVSEDTNVQKISLVCFCKQELSSLMSKLESIYDEVTNLTDQCDRAISEKHNLDQEVALIEKYLASHKWNQKKVQNSSSFSNNSDMETIDRLHQSLCDLKSRKMITSDFFKKNQKVLEHAERFLINGLKEEDENGIEERGKGPGLLFSCMPVMIVTSALMVYNYCSPVSLLQKFCRLYNVQENS